MALIYRLNQVYFKLGLKINRVSAYQFAQKLPLSETIGFPLILKLGLRDKLCLSIRP